MDHKKTPWEDKKQPGDEVCAGDVWFYKTTYVVIQEGLKGLLKELRKYDDVVRDLNLAASPYEREMHRLEQLVEWGDERLKMHPHEYDQIEITRATFGTLRYIKAAILLQVRKHEAKLSQIIERGPVPQSIVRAFEDKVSELRNLAEQGRLNGLRPIEMFLDLAPQENAGQGPSEGERTSSQRPHLPVVRQDIPLTDAELRKRCLNLFDKIDDPNASPSQPQETLDTIVGDMSRILEDRIRQLGGINKDSGSDLLTVAFTREPPRFDFGKGKKSQSAVYDFFKGYFDFVRNDVLHNLIPTYTRERVLQLLGLVDYLLFLLTMASIQRPDAQEPPASQA